MTGAPSRRSFLFLVTGAFAGASSARLASAEAIAIRLGSRSGLSDDERSILIIAAEAVTAVDELLYNYGQYYAYHSSKYPQKAAVYGTFVDDLMRFARSDPAAFLSLPRDRAHRIVLSYRSGGQASPEIETHVFQAALLVFINNDAWAQLGYESWAGMPRGLEAYRLPPGRG